MRRSHLQRLAEGSLAHNIPEPVLTRSARPFWVHRQPEQLIALFPVYLRGRADDVLLNTFAQVRPASVLPMCLSPCFPTLCIVTATISCSNAPSRDAATGAAVSLSCPMCSLGWALNMWETCHAFQCAADKTAHKVGSLVLHAC